MIVHFLKSSVMMNLSHLEAKAAVLTDGGLIRHSVQLDVLDRMTQSTASTVAYSYAARNFNNRDRMNKSLSVASVFTILINRLR